MEDKKIVFLKFPNDFNFLYYLDFFYKNSPKFIFKERRQTTSSMKEKTLPHHQIQGVTAGMPHRHFEKPR